MVAALADFTQVHDVGTLRVGDTSIQLVKFGTGEARITAALRTDGIVRGLGGLFAGTFTTTQRDAIAAGSRPYGLIILNSINNRLEMNFGTDAVPSWQAIGVVLGTAAGQALPGNHFSAQAVAATRSAGPLSPGATVTLAAPAAGTYIVEYGMERFFSGSQGDSMNLTCNVASGNPEFGTVSSSGGPAVNPGIVLTNGQNVTVNVNGSGGTQAFGVWIKLTRTA